MRVLIVSPRFPEPRLRGDQSRAFGHVSYLARHHDVLVVSAEAPSDQAALVQLRALADVRVVTAGRLTRLLSALGFLARGRPGQVAWMMPNRCWREVLRCSQETDVVLASTVRAIRGRLSAPLVIDYVDALSANMAIRAEGPEAWPIRLVARAESWLLRRWEKTVAAGALAALVTSSQDGDLLPPEPAAQVLPVGWDGPIELDRSAGRDIDVILTGNMGYPPNAQAAKLLASEIVPALRSARPETSVYVVGRRADRLGLAGVSVAADVPDVTAFLRRAKVAIAPLRGTGSPYKVLEAAASGAAIVASPFALRAFAMPGIQAVAPNEFAKGVLDLLDDEERRRELVSQSLAALENHTVEALGRRLECILTSAAQ